MHTYTPANSVFDGLIANLHSIWCILIEIPGLLRAHANGGGDLNDFKFGTFIGRFFQNDEEASIAANALMV